MRSGLTSPLLSVGRIPDYSSSRTSHSSDPRCGTHRPPGRLHAAPRAFLGLARCFVFDRQQTIVPGAMQDPDAPRQVNLAVADVAGHELAVLVPVIFDMAERRV